MMSFLVLDLRCGPICLSRLNLDSEDVLKRHCFSMCKLVARSSQTRVLVFTSIHSKTAIISRQMKQSFACCPKYTSCV